MASAAMDGKSNAAVAGRSTRNVSAIALRKSRALSESRPACCTFCLIGYYWRQPSSMQDNAAYRQHIFGL